MKKRIVLAVVLLSFTFSIHAQLVVAAPNVEAAVEKQSIQTMRIAFEEKIRQFRVSLL